MVQVSEQLFHKFLAENSHTINGAMTSAHETSFLDEEMNVIATHETSSWGAPDTYHVDSDEAVYTNYEATILFTNLINSFEKII